jgi:hypothetical protein
MFKRIATAAATIAAAATLAVGIGGGAQAAAPHQTSQYFSLNTYYGQTSSGWSGISLNSKTSTVASYLIDKRDGHCSTLQARAILSTPSGATRGPFATVVTNCSEVNWAYGSRPLNVTSGSPNLIIGLEARICQANSFGTVTGVCTTPYPINI